MYSKTIAVPGIGGIAGTLNDKLTGTNTITGTGTEFLEWAVGDEIIVGGNSYTIDAIASATSLTSADANTAVWDAPMAYDMEHRDIQMKLNVLSRDPPDIRGAGTPLCRSDFLTYNAATNVVTFKHDILDAAEPYGEIVPATGAGSEYWVGGMSITKVGSTFYVAYRERDAANRGWKLKGISCADTDDITDPADWTLNWTASESDITPFVPDSFEKVSLKYINSKFVLYFSIAELEDATPYKGQWQINMVESATWAGLEAEIEDSDGWTVLVNGAKDPEVFEVDGDYWMVLNPTTQRRHDGVNLWAMAGYCADQLYRASAYNGPYTFVCDLGELYLNANVTEMPMALSSFVSNNGTIFYDSSSGYFIYWGSILAGASPNDTYWWYAVSTDMVNWKYAGRETVTTTNFSVPFARYPTYWSLDDQRVILLMEWDADEDGDRSIHLWDYSTDAAGSSATTAKSDNGAYLSNHALANFSDVYFETSSVATPFWLEDYESGVFAKFRVKVPVIEDEGGDDRTLTMKWNAGTTGASSLDDTFVFADDFDDEDFTTKWDDKDYNEGVSTEQNDRIELAITGQNRGAMIISKSTINMQSKQVEVYITTPVAVGTNLFLTATNPATNPNAEANFLRSIFYTSDIADLWLIKKVATVETVLWQESAPLLAGTVVWKFPGIAVRVFENAEWPGLRYRVGTYPLATRNLYINLAHWAGAVTTGAGTCWADTLLVSKCIEPAAVWGAATTTVYTAQTANAILFGCNF